MQCYVTIYIMILSWREGDKVIAINNRAPRTVEEAVTIIRDAGKHIQVEVVSEADRLQAQQPSQPPSDSGSSAHAHHRPSPYVRTSGTSPAPLRPPGPSGHNDIRRGQVISPGMGEFTKDCCYYFIYPVQKDRDNTTQTTLMRLTASRRR